MNFSSYKMQYVVCYSNKDESPYIIFNKKSPYIIFEFDIVFKKFTRRNIHNLLSDFFNTGLCTDFPKKANDYNLVYCITLWTFCQVIF